MFLYSLRIGAFLLCAGLGLGPFLLGCGSSGVATDDSEERVSVGYGTQDANTVTSAVSHMDVAETRRQVTRVEELLERVPGVRLLRLSGGGYRVQIRGVSSVNGRTDPLYVVDDMIIEVDPVQGLYWLNPADVATIDVLKGASATAIYGSRGGAGVIVIRTRTR